MHWEEVVLTVFNYMTLLRSSDIELYHFEEQRDMSAVSFRFREKSQPHSYSTWLCDQLLEPYPPAWVLSGSSLLRRWDESLIRDILGLLTPERGRVMIMAKHHDSQVVGEDLEWHTERWYGTEYHVQRLSQEFIDKVHVYRIIRMTDFDIESFQANLPNEIAELHLPSRNPYIPQDLSVEHREVTKVRTEIPSFTGPNNER